MISVLSTNRELPERAKHEGCLLSLKWGWRTLQLGQVMQHLWKWWKATGSICPSEFQTSICHETILIVIRGWCFSSKVLGHTRTLSGHVFLTRRRWGGKNYGSVGKGWLVAKSIGMTASGRKRLAFTPVFCSLLWEHPFFQVFLKALSLTDQVRRWCEYIWPHWWQSWLMLPLDLVWSALPLPDLLTLWGS